MLISRLTLTLAIAKEEGYFDPFPLLGGKLNRPQRNRNPGNLRWAPARFPQIGKEGPADNQYVVFKDHLAGWAAAENDIFAKTLKRDPDFPDGWDLIKMLSVFCPAGDGKNDPAAYAEHVAKRIGTVSNIPLHKLVLGEGRVLGPWVSGPLPGPPVPNWADIINWCISAGIHRT